LIKDGHKDLWTNAGDALASAANYLTNSMAGSEGQPWAVETRIPEVFDYSLGDGRKLTVAAWKALGLLPATAASWREFGFAAGGAVPAGGIVWTRLPAVRQFRRDQEIQQRRQLCVWRLACWRTGWRGGLTCRGHGRRTS
jgi:hypothetical protein